MKSLFPLTFALLALTVPGHADEEKISLESAPAAVRQSIQAHAGSNKILKVEKATDEGALQYEVLAQKPDGKKIEYIIKPDGSLEATEEKLTKADLPKAAQDKIDGLVGKGTLTTVERVTHGSTVTYEAGYRSATGEEREAVFSSGGKLLKDGMEKD